jgi:N-acetylglucosaminyl-diphospho-decaprenol L-rhamnosyltransferase
LLASYDQFAITSRRPEKLKVLCLGDTLGDSTGLAGSGQRAAACRPRITLSIVSHRNAAEVLQVLEDLVRSEPEPERIRVLVTMNVPEPARWVRSDWPLEVITLRNARAKGYAANHNEAFRRCETPYFGVMNPDLRLPGPVVTELCDRLAVSGAAMAAPVMTDYAGARADNARPLITPLEIGKRFASRHWGRRRIGHRSEGRYDWVAGMFMVFDREAFAAMGGFDQHFYLYCEDFDICARLRLAGRTFDVCEDLRVVHGARRRSHRDVRFLAWHVSSLLRAWTSSTFWEYRRMLVLERRRLAEPPRTAPFIGDGQQAEDYRRSLQTGSVAGYSDDADQVGAEHSAL